VRIIGRDAFEHINALPGVFERPGTPTKRWNLSQNSSALPGRPGDMMVTKEVILVRRTIFSFESDLQHRSGVPVDKLFSGSKIGEFELGEQLLKLAEGPSYTHI
jgi:hypothetical protein